MSDKRKYIRGRIDALDERLVKLLSARAGLAQNIGSLKQGSVYRPEREAQVLRHIAQINPGPLSGRALARVFTEIMSACRALEDSVTVAYLGPQGTFSQEAVLKHFGSGAPAVPCASIDEVFRQVETGIVGFGVVPVENSTEGAIGRTLDLLLTTPAAARRRARPGFAAAPRRARGIHAARAWRMDAETTASAESAGGASS